jgi:hypothetical protein
MRAFIVFQEPTRLMYCTCLFRSSFSADRYSMPRLTRKAAVSSTRGGSSTASRFPNLEHQISTVQLAGIVVPI